jgi:hypothetical protein
MFSVIFPGRAVAEAADGNRNPARAARKMPARIEVLDIAVALRDIRLAFCTSVPPRLVTIDINALVPNI